MYNIYNTLLSVTYSYRYWVLCNLVMSLGFCYEIGLYKVSSIVRTIWGFLKSQVPKRSILFMH